MTDKAEELLQSYGVDPNAAHTGAHAEDEPDLEGYDEAQRAEIAEFEGTGPTDGVMMTDMKPDMGGDIDDDEIEDDEDELDAIVDTDEEVLATELDLD